MRRPAFLFALCLAASAAAGQAPEPEPAGYYQCHVADRSDGFLDMYQSVTEEGAILRTWGAWTQKRPYFDSKKARREGRSETFLSARMNSGPPPELGDAPGWVDVADASITLHMLSAERINRPGLLMLSRPSRTGERYEPSLDFSAYSVEGEVSVLIPWRALKAFAGGVAELSWTLHRHVRGDRRWAQTATGRVDMRKLKAFADAVERARVPMDALRSDYRRQCQYHPPPDHSDTEI